MEKIESEQEYLIKQPNDGRIQIKQLLLLKNLLNYVESIDKKNITQIQSKIEEMLFKLIINNRITSDILSRYTSYIYIHIFNKGRNTHLSDLINSFIAILEQKDNNTKDISDNIKCNFLWIIGFICKRSEYKSPIMGNLMEILINICTDKVNSEMFMNESVRLMAKFLGMNISNIFGNKIPDIYKLIAKNERIITNKKYILKCIYKSLFYHENKELVELNFFHKKYNYIIELLENYYRLSDDSVNDLAVKTFMYLHDKIIFKEETIKEFIDDENKINKTKKVNIKGNELLNFIQVIYYFSQIDLLKYFTNKTKENSRKIISHIKIITYYIEKNKELININENIIDDIYELLLNCYSLKISINSLMFNDGLNSIQNTNVIQPKKPTKSENELNKIKSIDDDVNQNIILLFRTFIKSIYITSHRMNFLKNLFSKLKEVQTYIDKLTEDRTVTINDLSVLIDNGIINKVYTIPQINILLLSLLEISESNPELFELNFDSFQDISSNISFFLTSGIRSFRIFVSKFVCNLSYYLPSYRLSISALILNLIGILYADLVQMKNFFIYFLEVNIDQKSALKILKKLILFKDICNCLSMILATSKHKSKGIPIDTINDAFKAVKKIILGNQLAITDINKLNEAKTYSRSISEETYKYLSEYLFAYKESGWIILQGLISLDKKFIIKEYKMIFFLFNYTFNEKACDLIEDNLSKFEYREGLISQFNIKKEALHCFYKLILTFKDDEEYMDLFKDNIMYLLKYIIEFYINNENKKFLCFYQYHLKESYLEARKIIYNIFYNLPLDYYYEHYNTLIYSISDDIIKDNNYTQNFSFLDILNKTNTLLCLERLSVDNTKYKSQFYIDNFYLPLFSKYNNLKEDSLQDYFTNKSFNFKYLSIILLVKIFSSEKLKMKNKNMIMQFFLNSITDIVVKGLNFSNVLEKNKNFEDMMNDYNKLVNIVVFVFLFLKYSVKYNIPFPEDLELFTNIKMIFDLCHKIEDFGYISIMACEGISLLINLYNKKEEALEHYLNLCEIKFNNEKNIPKINDFINSFYLIANIFINVDYKHIKPFIDKFMNFIISFFNPNDSVLISPYVGQSLLCLSECLLKQKEYGKVRQIIQIYKMNAIYINISNVNYIKNKFISYSRVAYESINELKLIMILIKRYENLQEDDHILIKCIINKFMNDELYKNDLLIRHYLIFINEVLNLNLFEHFSEYILNLNFLDFLFEYKTNYSNNILSLCIINYLLTNNYKEIEKLNDDNSYLKNKMSSVIKKINELYHTNKNIYYMNKIYKIFYDKQVGLTNNINDILGFDNIFDKKFKNYHLIMIYKKIIELYIAKNYTNFDTLVNFLKIILQKKMDLYKSVSESSKNNKSAEGGDEGLKDNQDNINIDNTKLLFNITDLKFIFFINLQKHLIKQIIRYLLKYVEEILSIKPNNNNKNIIEKSKIDILGKLMSISMILIQCEESWEIKYLGINLLNKLIIKFSNIKDSRSDEDSLLIQQYEVQISSCIKNIFFSKSKSPVTFKSISKGLNLIYLFLTISISNDTEFIKKFDEYIHFMDFLKNDGKIKISENNKFYFCSKKEENVINLKFFILTCKLFISSFTKKTFSIKYLSTKSNSKNNIEFYSTYMSEEIKNELIKLFTNNIQIFCQYLKNILLDLYNNYISEENKDNDCINLNQSQKILVKYYSIFLTLISILFHNNELKNYDNVFDIKFWKFIFLYTFCLLKKIKFYKNIDSINYIIDIFSSIISTDKFKFSFELYELCIKDLIYIFEIKEYHENKNILSLFQKLISIKIDKSSINNDKIISTIETESKLIKKIKELYSFNKYNSILISIYNSYILKLIQIYKKEDGENIIMQEIESNTKLLYGLYLDSNDNNLNKIILEKIFTILLNITQDQNILFKKYIEQLVNTLISIKENFQKYFTLFYIIIQYLTKSTNDELNKEIKSYYIKESLNINHKLFDTSNKAILLSLTQIKNDNLKLFTNEYLSSLFNSNEKNIFVQDIQKLIILYVQNEKNVQLRQNLIKNLIVYINNNIEIKDSISFVLGIIKINSEDSKLLEEESVQKSMNEEFKNKLKELTQEKENKIEEKKDNEDEADDDFDEIKE